MIAKNLLENKTCDNCRFIHSFDKTTVCLRKKNESLVNGVPAVRTCTYWLEFSYRASYQGIEYK